MTGTKKNKGRKVLKSAKSGKFVSKKEAKCNPDTTFEQKVK